ncbi:MAG: hypothetical protein E7G41_02540 [Bifidobacterium sp.]|nr:hypothetical protein [Bifidobacterium sp.]
MLFIPNDLFGAWIKGREYGIDRNWNDLNQSNNVEQGWLQNDAQQLSNWFKQDTYNDQLARSNAGARTAVNQADGSDLNLQLARTQQPGALATAGLQSDTQIALANAGRNNLPNYVTAQSNTWDANNTLSNARADAVREFGAQQVSNTARANTQNALNAAIQADYFQDTLPLQQQVREADLAAQQRILQNAGQQPTAVTTPGGFTAPSGPVDAPTISALNQGLAAGSTTTVNGPNNMPITVGKTAAGQLYYVVNGQQVPLSAPTAPASGYGNLGTW